MESAELIRIVVSKGIPYIWTAKEWHALRVEHHVVGKFDGAGHEEPSNDKFPTLNFMQMNLPLRLSSVETQYLVKNDKAKTFQVPEMMELKPPVDINGYKRVCTARQFEQMERYKLKRRVDVESRVDEIIKGKMRKGREVPDKETIIQIELGKITKAPVQVDLKDPWVPDFQKYEPYCFPMPQSPLDKLRLRVFEDFTLNRNYYITNGMKFGGDYLAYPGDPMNYHAEYIIVCVSNYESLHKSHVIAGARLASIVKKTLLIAFIDKKTDILKYKPIKSPCYDSEQDQNGLG